MPKILKGTTGSRKGEVTERTTVNGGWVKREARSGRFVEVGTENGTAKARPKSEAAAKEAASKRAEALQRLANR